MIIFVSHYILDKSKSDCFHIVSNILIVTLRQFIRVTKPSNIEIEVTYLNFDECVFFYIEMYIYNVVKSKIRSGPCGYSLSYLLVLIKQRLRSCTVQYVITYNFSTNKKYILTVSYYFLTKCTICNSLINNQRISIFEHFSACEDLKRLYAIP